MRFGGASPWEKIEIEVATGIENLKLLYHNLRRYKNHPNINTPGLLITVI